MIGAVYELDAEARPPRVRHTPVPVDFFADLCRAVTKHRGRNATLGGVFLVMRDTGRVSITPHAGRPLDLGPFGLDRVWLVEIGEQLRLTTRDGAIAYVAVLRSGTPDTSLDPIDVDVPPPSLDTPTSARIAWWLRNGETGMSSRAILGAFESSIASRPSYPHDPADLRRCALLLALVPEARAGLDALAAVSPYWSALVGEWDALVAGVTGDGQSERWHATYKRMRELLEPVELAQRANAPREPA